MSENPWIDSAKELPPCNGQYQVTNNIDKKYTSIIGMCEYDGYGFCYLGIYKEPLYWRHLGPQLEKINGKID